MTPKPVRVAANSAKHQKKRKPTPASWKPGQSGNPKGRPALGESYREIFSAAGNLTIGELRERYPTYAVRFAAVPGDIKLKELVALSVLVGLACEPTPGMLATLLDRTDGPVEHVINLSKMSNADIAEAIKPVLARVGVGIEPPGQAGLDGNTVTTTTGYY